VAKAVLAVEQAVRGRIQQVTVGAGKHWTVSPRGPWPLSFGLCPVSGRISDACPADGHRCVGTS
jgi:hypothetical protein